MQTPHSAYSNDYDLGSMHGKSQFYSTQTEYQYPYQIPHQGSYQYQADNGYTVEQHNQSLISHRPAPRQRSPSKWKALCRSFGLQVPYNGIKKMLGHANIEEPKVAMSKNRWLALCRGAIHFIPVVAAILLIALNATDYYIGGELAGEAGADTQKLAALQFSAKIHELFMLASIAVIVFAYVRRELTMGNGIPFGALFAGLQVTSLSFLWSTEMWGVINTRWNSRRKKATLISLLLLATFLGLGAGPSTAVLMRPRLDYWPAGGTTFWVNGTQDELRPLAIGDETRLRACTEDTGDPFCPHTNWNSVSEQYLSTWNDVGTRSRVGQAWYIPSDMGTLYFAVAATGQRIYSNARTLTVGPTFYMANTIAEFAWRWANAAVQVQHAKPILMRYTFRRNAIAAVPDWWAPAVQVLCHTEKFDNAAPQSITFPNIGSYYIPEGQGISGANKVWDYSAIIVADETLIKPIQSLYDAKRYGVIFLDDSALLSQTKSSLQAVLNVPAGDSTTYIHACAVDARWAKATLSAARTEDTNVKALFKSKWADDGFQNDENPQMTISAAWARYLDPVAIGGTNSNDTVFSRILGQATDVKQIREYAESVLAALVVNGLSRVAKDRKYVGQWRNLDDESMPRNSWQWCMMPKSKYCTSDSAFDIDSAVAAESTRLTFTATNEGYAYATRGIAAKVSMGVLITYSLFALTHFFYSIFTGWTSIAWDTPAEIAALAIQSETSKKLNNTGAGIDTTETFEEKVQIKVRDGTLEYVFSDTGQGGTRVVKNHNYA